MKKKKLLLKLIPACPPPIVSLPSAPCMGMVNTPANITQVRVAPVLQTIEVLPQNIDLGNPPTNLQLSNQTFLLATPAQPSLPLSTTLPSNQIIIQTIPVSIKLFKEYFYSCIMNFTGFFSIKFAIKIFFIFNIQCLF